ncbi:MAG: bifunctional methionine sulfoxide reductase B/A protein [Phycisphaerales bacterium]
MLRIMTNIGAGVAGLAAPLALLWAMGLPASAAPGDGGNRHYTLAPKAVDADGTKEKANVSDASKASGRIISRSGYDVTPLTDAQKAPLIAKLTPEQYRITQKAGTEAAFCGTLLDNKLEGFYGCVVCNLPLFDSDDKFVSGTGWPSFTTTTDRQHVHGEVDKTFGMVRTEILCARCDAHLGHVFEDGPKPTGLRFCLNSEAMTFFERGRELPVGARPVATETAYFAGGCFWGVEHYFQKGDGVIDVSSGYMNGTTKNPTYKDITTGATGHAEAVKVVFDPTRISYETLLEAFFIMHDPTTLNQQGPDRGTQYRSGVYAVNAEQLAAAKKHVAELTMKGRFSRPIVTEIEMAETFYVAEDYHQDYIEQTGRSCSLTNPWPVMAKTAAATAGG